MTDRSGQGWLDAEPGDVTVRGCRIRFRALGDPLAAPVVLVHGGGAHAGWWLDVVPLLAPTHRVVVLELSGHGDSDHRSAYSDDDWVDEIATVIEATDGGPAHVVGHSMGGLVAIHLASSRPEVVRSLTILDSAVVRKTGPTRREPRRVKHYATIEEAVTHFHLRPSGTVADPETLELVARAGLRRAPEGWRWKADPAALHYFPRNRIDAALRMVQAPVAFAYGERSEIVDVTSPDRVEELTGRPVARLAIGSAYHHLPLDAPGECARWIDRQVLAGATTMRGRVG